MVSVPKFLGYVWKFWRKRRVEARKEREENSGERNDYPNFFYLDVLKIK